MNREKEKIKRERGEQKMRMISMKEQVGSRLMNGIVVRSGQDSEGGKRNGIERCDPSQK